MLSDEAWSQFVMLPPCQDQNTCNYFDNIRKRELSIKWTERLKSWYLLEWTRRVTEIFPIIMNNVKALSPLIWTRWLLWRKMLWSKWNNGSENWKKDKKFIPGIPKGVQQNALGNNESLQRVHSIPGVNLVSIINFSAGFARVCKC